MVTMRSLFVFLVGFAAISAIPLKDDDGRSQRIVGGSTTTIQTYPEMAALLFVMGGTSVVQACGGTILNNRAILTAAHCIFGHQTAWWRARLGSTRRDRGGTVVHSARFIHHPQYNRANLDNDVSIIHVDRAISFSNSIRPTRLAGANYHIADNQVVWAVGWGRIRENGPSSDQLRHVQIWTINQQICRNQHATVNQAVTDNMLCSGWLNVGGRDQCSGDSGGPLLHNRVQIGICSFGYGCARHNFAGVNVRVPRVVQWITANG